MKVDEQKMIDDFGLIAFGGKGWMSGENLKCPECGKGGKFGIKLSNRGGAVHCFICDYSDHIVQYLKKIGRNDLVEYEESVRLDTHLRYIGAQEEDSDELVECTLPKGYERIYFDSYLKSRNFKAHQYDQFEVGVTNHFLERRLKNYLIFVLKQQGKIVGWLARSKYSKEWHKDNLEKYKSGIGKLMLRYENSKGTDFDKILGGFDEITTNTSTVILVEGLLDKTNLSNILKTNKSEDTKVCCTFGNKVSDHQIKLLRMTNIKNIILMYDEGTILQSRKYSAELSKHFNVDVCSIEDPDIDPGNADEKFITDLLFKKKNFLYFYTSKLNFK